MLETEIANNRDSERERERNTAKFCSICRQQFHGSAKPVSIKLKKERKRGWGERSIHIFPIILKQDIQCTKHSVLAFFMLIRTAGQQKGTLPTKNLMCFTQLSSETLSMVRLEV
jgi:hypothetical protein